MITRVNPDTLHRNPAYSQAAIIDPSARLVYVGGQNAVNQKGEIVGDTISDQTVQAMNNLVAALEACGVSLKDVFKMTIYIVQGQPLQEGFMVAQQFHDLSTHPPTISGIFVAGLAHPDFLLEIEAVAAVK
jgi:enamine deaminase RidA (YjgF/YER057c/UK114 family)